MRSITRIVFPGQVAFALWIYSLEKTLEKELQEQLFRKYINPDVSVITTEKKYDVVRLIRKEDVLKKMHGIIWLQEYYLDALEQPILNLAARTRTILAKNTDTPFGGMAVLQAEVNEEINLYNKEHRKAK